jgi:hypothetical protein
MASSSIVSTTNTATTTPTHMHSHVTQLTTLSHLLTIKLSRDNYLLWTTYLLLNLPLSLTSSNFQVTL